LDENIQEKINTNYIAYKVSKIFAEVHIQKAKLLIYLRPIDNYNDPDGKISKIPDNYNWVLDRRVYINKESEIDYVMVLIEQSYIDIL
jgi:predicted transport protein